MYPVRRAAAAADPDDRGRGTWEVKRVASGERIVVRESRGKGAGGDRKAPKRSQFVRTLVLGRLHLRTNQGGIWQAKRTQFRAVEDTGTLGANHVSRAPASRVCRKDAPGR